MHQPVGLGLLPSTRTRRRPLLSNAKIIAVLMLEPAVDFQKHAGDDEDDDTTDDGGFLTLRNVVEHGACDHENEERSD